jgi:hypothetical protein
MTAYAPETKPAVLDGSAPPIAASAADAVPMRRAAEQPTPQKPARLARQANAVASAAAADVKPAAKPLKTAQARHRVRTAHAKPLPAPTAYTRSLSANASDKPMPARHKKLAAAKPKAEEGDGDIPAKPAFQGKPLKVHSHPGKPPEGE